MTAFSLGTVWEETIAFLRRERGLMIPVALAIFGPAQLLLGVAMAGAAGRQATSAVAAGGQAFLILPAALAVLFGNIVVALMVLTPGISVGEALSRAVGKLPRSLAVMLLLMLGFIFVALIIVIAATLGAMTFGADPRAVGTASQIALLIVIPMAVLVIRMLLLAPVVAMEPLAPVAAIRRIWALSTNNVLRFLAIWLLAMFLGVLIALIEQFVIGSVFALLKLAVGEAELLDVLQQLISAGFEAMLSLGMAVYLALVYRKLAANPAG